MRILFGPALDGPCFPDLLRGRTGAAGEVVAGPQGFLRLLETRLGLSGSWVDPLTRRLQYALRLRHAAAASGELFFARSLAVDELGSAARLLDWRDQLIAGGWNGRADTGAPARLRDLAAVEAIPSDSPLAAGTAERLHSVLARLAGLAVLPTGIRSVELAGDPDDLPPPWREILGALAGAGVLVSRRPDPEVAAKGDLGRLQKALRAGRSAGRSAGGAAVARPRAQGDGSLVFLTASSETLAADLLARHIAADPSGWVIVDPVGDADDMLDRALRRQGIAATGAAPVSPWRPALLVLPLALALRWRPLDPRRLLEFLLIPGGPVQRFAASRLAGALAEAPGIGGPVWIAALEDLRARAREWKPEPGEEPAATDAAERADALIRRIRDWLEAERYDPEQGIPVEEARAVAARVVAWAQGRHAFRPDPLLPVAAGQAARLRELLGYQAGARIGRLALETLLDAVTRGGAPHPGALTEAGHPAVVHDPGALLAPARRILWWNFTEAADRPPATSPWSRAERTWLAARGVRLVEPAAQWRAYAARNLAPLRLAAESLVLAAPQRVRGEVVSPHPAWDAVAAIFGDGIRALVADADESVRAGVPFLGKPVELEPVPARPLPELRRWWQLPKDVRLAPRDIESFSSLEKFVYHPFHWVLHYPAGLRSSAAGALAADNRLLGTLAHVLIQEVAADPVLVRRGSEDDVRRRVQGRLPALLEQAGALLLQRGFELDCKRLEDRSARAAWLLVQAMRRGGWTLRSAEEEWNGGYFGGKLTGRIDLVLDGSRGRRGVLDLKWGGRTQRFDDLRDNRALQLAVYGWLVGGDRGSWPDCGFLIIDGGEILASDGEAFPGATPVASAEGSSATLWGRFEKTWKWRARQLAAGRVEVPVEGTSADEQSLAPAGCLNVGEPCPFNDFVNLTGWESDHA